MAVRLIVEFTALEGRENDIIELISDYAAQVRAEAGNTVFEAFRKANHPEHFYLIEAFEDKAAHHEHLSSNHRVRFDAALMPMVAEPDLDRTFIDKLV